jgi:hypothetical protein
MNSVGEQSALIGQFEHAPLPRTDLNVFVGHATQVDPNMVNPALHEYPELAHSATDDGGHAVHPVKLVELTKKPSGHGEQIP